MMPVLRAAAATMPDGVSEALDPWRLRLEPWRLRLRLVVPTLLAPVGFRGSLGLVELLEGTG